MYSLPRNNDTLILGESSNDYFCQHKYINTAIFNSNDSISSLDNISNTVTADNEHLLQTYVIPYSASYLTPPAPHTSSILGPKVLY